jgi:type I restriction enzyme, R subunit
LPSFAPETPSEPISPAQTLIENMLSKAYRTLTRVGAPSLETRNRAFHRWLVAGVNVEYTRADGSIAGAQVNLIDFDHPENNDWAAVNQFTVVEGQTPRRPDVVIFLNGLPVVLMELKNPADGNATIWKAFDQIQTYKNEIPSLFTYNEILIISDGVEARVGSLTADRERFMPWRSIEGENLAPASLPQLQVVIQGLLEKRRLLDFLRYFVSFRQACMI